MSPVVGRRERERVEKEDTKANIKMTKRLIARAHYNAKLASKRAAQENK